MLPVPSTLPGTNRMSFSFVVLFILVKFTTRLEDDGFRASSASLAQIDALFSFDAILRSLARCKTIWLVNRLMPF